MSVPQQQHLLSPMTISQTHTTLPRLVWCWIVVLFHWVIHDKGKIRRLSALASFVVAVGIGFGLVKKGSFRFNASAIEAVHLTNVGSIWELCTGRVMPGSGWRTTARSCRHTTQSNFGLANEGPKPEPDSRRRSIVSLTPCLFLRSNFSMILAITNNHIFIFNRWEQLEWAMSSSNNKYTHETIKLANVLFPFLSHHIESTLAKHWYWLGHCHHHYHV